MWDRDTTRQEPRTDEGFPVTDTFDEQLLTRYLLGDLPAAQRERIDDRAAEDPDFFEDLCALEDDLILKHLRGELSARDNELFAAAFATPARQRQIESERALLTAARTMRPAPPASTSMWKSIVAWLTTPRLIPSFAVAAAAVVLVYSAPVAIYSTYSALVNPASTASGSSPRVIVVAGLAGDDQRGGGGGAERTLVVPPEATDVRFSVALPPGAGDALDVVLERSEGGVLTTSGRWQLADRGAALTLTMPAGEVPAGDYTLIVRRPSSTDPDLAAHSFRVRRE